MCLYVWELGYLGSLIRPTTEPKSCKLSASYVAGNPLLPHCHVHLQPCLHNLYIHMHTHNIISIFFTLMQYQETVCKTSTTLYSATNPQDLKYIQFTPPLMFRNNGWVTDTDRQVQLHIQELLDSVVHCTGDQVF